MRKFKDFLNEAGAGMMPPHLSYNNDPNWIFPSSATAHYPTSFKGLAQQHGYWEKPLYKSLTKLQYVVQNIVSEPENYGILKNNIQGNPKTGGKITGLTHNVLVTPGTASHGYKLSPVEFNYLKNSGVLSERGSTVEIDLGKLYQLSQSEINKDVGKDMLATGVDTALQAMVQPGTGSQPLQRSAWQV